VAKPPGLGRNVATLAQVPAYLFGSEVSCDDMVTVKQTYDRRVTTPNELGTVISELRTHRRKTQFEVSTALAIDRSQLAHLEGGRAGRYLSHLLNILDHLDAEIHIHWRTDTNEPTEPVQPPRPPAARAKVAEAKPPSRPTPTTAAAPINAPASDSDPDPESIHEPAADSAPGSAADSPPVSTVSSDSGTAQLAKITNVAMNVVAMNVMAASQQLTGVPPRQPLVTPAPEPEPTD
jgi:transcriptional regulator with XRE-family HTH domain